MGGLIYDPAAGSMSLCPLQVISAAGVVRDSKGGFLRMEPVVKEIEFLIVAVGRTDLIEDELQSVGFQWSAVNKVWYHLGDFTDSQSEYFGRLAQSTPEVGICFRCFEHIDNEWTEIQQ